MTGINGTAKEPKVSYCCTFWISVYFPLRILKKRNNTEETLLINNNFAYNDLSISYSNNAS